MTARAMRQIALLGRVPCHLLMMGCRDGNDLNVAMVHGTQAAKNDRSLGPELKQD
jgi:hypothetical protein